MNNLPEWFLKISPNLQVPILLTDLGEVLFESDAICEYLDDIFTSLQNKITPEQRAVNRAWSYQTTKHYLVQCSIMRSPSESIFLDRLEKLLKAFARLEKILDSRLYFQSEVIGNVDIAWFVLLHRLDIVKKYSSYDFLMNYPKIKKWKNTLLKLNLARRSVSEDFEEKFSNFYLSDKTYLGRRQDSPATLPTKN